MNPGGMSQRKKISAFNHLKLKDRSEEDLVLFREMHKREKEGVVSLLQPVSEEFEPNGNSQVYRMSLTAKREQPGLEFLGGHGKNDYDWLKTPPATPLFPSLEMEAKASEIMGQFQRDIPIIQPLSRFATKPSDVARISNKASNTKPKLVVPSRCITPSRISSSSSNSSGSSSSSHNNNNWFAEKKNMKGPAPIKQIIMNKMNQLSGSCIIPPTDPIKTPPPAPASSSNARQDSDDVQITAKAKTRKGSASDETTPLNIRTDRRALSASRFRPPAAALNNNNNNNNNKNQAVVSSASVVGGNPQAFSTKTRRQSCSPAVNRGRKFGELGDQTFESNSCRRQVMGSKMVDKVLHARKHNAAAAAATTTSNEGNERVTKANNHRLLLNGSINESSGFGRMKSNTSFDMALKHMEIKGKPVNSRRPAAGNNN